MPRMTRTPAAALAALAALTLAAAAAAQTAAPPPRPGVLMIVREEVKPGRGATHEAHEAAWARAYRRANSSSYYVGMSAISGPSEAWYLVGFASLADMAEQQRKTEADPALASEIGRLAAGEEQFISGARTVIARLRDDLSHGAPTNPADRRFFRVTTYRVRPGTAPDFARHRRTIKEAMEKAGPGPGAAVYEVIAGMPTPTFLVVTARRSLDAFEDTTGSGAYRLALGDSGRATLARLAKEAFGSVESNLFAVSPRMSYMPAEVVAADPAFWQPTSVAAKPELARKKAAARP